MKALVLFLFIVFLAPFIAVLCYLGRHKEFWQWLGIVLGMLLLVGAAFVAFVLIMLAGVV